MSHAAAAWIDAERPGRARCSIRTLFCAGNGAASPVNREIGRILLANHGNVPLSDSAEYANKAGGAGDFGGSSREPPETGFWRRGRDSNPRYPVKDTPDLAMSPPSASNRAPARLFETQQGLMKYELLRRRSSKLRLSLAESHSLREVFASLAPPETNRRIR